MSNININICNKHPCLARNPACSLLGQYHEQNLSSINISYKRPKRGAMAMPRNLGFDDVWPSFAIECKTCLDHSSW